MKVPRSSAVVAWTVTMSVVEYVAVLVGTMTWVVTVEQAFWGRACARPARVVMRAKTRMVAESVERLYGSPEEGGLAIERQAKVGSRVLLCIPLDDGSPLPRAVETGSIASRLFRCGRHVLSSQWNGRIVWPFIKWGRLSGSRVLLQRHFPSHFRERGTAHACLPIAATFSYTPSPDIFAHASWEWQ